VAKKEFVFLLYRRSSMELS